MRRNHNNTASNSPSATTTPPAIHTVVAAGEVSRLLTSFSRTWGIVSPTTEAAMVTTAPQNNRRRIGLVMRHKRPMAWLSDDASGRRKAAVVEGVARVYAGCGYHPSH